MSLQQQIEALREELEQYRSIFEAGGEDYRYAKAFKAPPQLAAVIKALHIFPLVGTRSLMAIADSHGTAEDHGPEYARMMIYRVRKLLRPFKITVESRPTYGYAIDQKDKAKIKELIGE